MVCLLVLMVGAVVIVESLPLSLEWLINEATIVVIVNVFVIIVIAIAIVLVIVIVIVIVISLALVVGRSIHL